MCQKIFTLVTKPTIALDRKRGVVCMLEKHRSTLVAGGRCGVRWGQCEHQLRLKEEDDVFCQLASSRFESYSPKDKGA